jgi:hypothetical protein
MLCEALLAASALALSFGATRARTALHLALAAVLSAALLGELQATRALGGGAPDYGDLGLGPGQGRFAAGGQLAPDLDLVVIGDAPDGRVRFATEAHGFRRGQRLAEKPPAGVFRVLLAGDSFGVGYRVDQAQSPGAVLERALGPAPIEVAAGRVDDPVYAWDWLERFGLSFEPDLVVLLVTLANDAAGCWLHLQPGGEYELRGGALARNAAPPAIGFRTAPLADTCLPASAFASWNPLAETGEKLLRLRLAARLRGPDARTGSAAWYADRPRRVHALDLVHSLGLYLAGEAPPLVEEAVQRMERAIAGVRDAVEGRGVSLVVVPIPARIEVDERDWSATVARYALDPAAFDRERPRRELADFCARAGIASIDLAPAFRAAAARGERLFLPAGDMHWSARGAVLAGETMAAALRDGGLVP